MTSSHSCGFSNVGHAKYCGGCGQKLPPATGLLDMEALVSDPAFKACYDYAVHIFYEYFREVDSRRERAGAYLGRTIIDVFLKTIMSAGFRIAPPNYESSGRTEKGGVFTAVADGDIADGQLVQKSGGTSRTMLVVDEVVDRELPAIRRDEALRKFEFVKPVETEASKAAKELMNRYCERAIRANGNESMMVGMSGLMMYVNGGLAVNIGRKIQLPGGVYVVREINHVNNMVTLDKCPSTELPDSYDSHLGRIGIDLASGPDRSVMSTIRTDDTNETILGRQLLTVRLDDVASAAGMPASQLGVGMSVPWDGATRQIVAIHDLTGFVDLDG